MSFIFFFFNDTATTEIYTLSLHDALPIYYLQPSLTPQACPSGRRLFPMTTSGSQQQLIAAPLCTLRRNSVGSDIREPVPTVTAGAGAEHHADRKSTRLNSSHSQISYAVFCLKKKKKQDTTAK